MGKKDKMAAKKNPISRAPSGNTGNCRLMQNLKTVNVCLVKEAADCRKEIERLRIQLTSLVAEEDIFHGIQRDVFALVVSSSLRESASRATAEMVAASNREKDLRMKIKSVTKDINAEEIELLALTKEKYEKEKTLADLKERIGSLEQTNEPGRRRRNLFCNLGVAASFIAAAGVTVLVACCIVFKK